MAKNPNLRMAAAAILNFGKSRILVQINPCMVNVYLPTEFEGNIFISNRDMAKNPKCNIAATAIFIFVESEMLGYSEPGMVNVYLHKNLRQIPSLVTEIWPKIQNLSWRPPPS